MIDNQSVMKNLLKNFLFVVLILIVISGFFSLAAKPFEEKKELSFTQLISEINQEKVKKIRAVSLGKMLGVMYGIMGLIFGGLITIFAILGSSLFTSEKDFGGIFFGIGAIILLPVIYGVLGFILGVIFGWIYNVAARWTGGLEVDILE